MRLLKPTAGLLAIGFTYLLLRELTGLRLFCPVKRIFGIYCPGCGVSRMFSHLAHFEIAQAFSSNCVLFCLLPIALIAVGYHAYRYVRYGSGRLRRAETVGVYIIIGVLVIFGVIRNLWQIDVLVP